MRRHLTFSNLVALGCLFIVLGGTSVAQDAISSAKKLITGKQIKNSTVTGKDVRNGSLTAKDIKGGLPAGPAGAQGPTGPTGPRGADGKDGAAGANGADGSPDTAAQVLAKLLTVDGPDSGLNADQLDGINGADLAAANDPRFTDARTPTGPAGGELTGTYPNPTIGSGVVDEANLTTFNARTVSDTSDVEIASYFFRILSGASTVRIAVTANGLASGGAGTVTIVNAAGAEVFSCPVPAQGVRAYTCVSPALAVAENSGGATGAYRVRAKATVADAPLIIRDIDLTFG